MTRYFLILFSFLSFTQLSCNAGPDSHKAKGFIIKGKIENYAGKQINLDEISQAGMIMLDTVTVDKNGKFEFKGTVKEKLFCALTIDKGTPQENRIFLMLDSSALIRVEADAKDLSKYKVEGSKESEEIQKFMTVNFTTQQKMNDIGKKYSQYNSSNTPDSIQQVMRMEYEKILKDREDQIYSLIENSKTLAAYFPIYFKMLEEFNFEPLEKTDSKYKDKYPDSKYVKYLSEYVRLNKNISVGSIAPNIIFPNPEGKEISLESLRGKIVVIDFWASWCGPCRRENPNNVIMYNKYHSKGLEIYGVSLDQDMAAWKKAIADDNLTWIHVSDLKGWGSAPAALYNVHGIPATYLIDRDGKIIAKNLRGEALDRKLAEILK